MSGAAPPRYLSRPCEGRDPYAVSLVVWKRSLLVAEIRQDRSCKGVLDPRLRGDDSGVVALRLECGLDQLDGVVAVPFSGTGDVAKLAAVAVDQHRCRHAEREPDAFQILKHPGLCRPEIAPPGQGGPL